MATENAFVPSKPSSHPIEKGCVDSSDKSSEAIPVKSSARAELLNDSQSEILSDNLVKREEKNVGSPAKMYVAFTQFMC